MAMAVKSELILLKGRRQNSVMGRLLRERVVRAAYIASFYCLGMQEENTCRV